MTAQGGICMNCGEQMDYTPLWPWCGECDRACPHGYSDGCPDCDSNSPVSVFDVDEGPIGLAAFISMRFH